MATLLMIDFKAYLKFVFFRFRRTENMDSAVMKGLMGGNAPQNLWARTAPEKDVEEQRYHRLNGSSSPV